MAKNQSVTTAARDVTWAAIRPVRPVDVEGIG